MKYFIFIFLIPIFLFSNINIAIYMASDNSMIDAYYDNLSQIVNSSVFLNNTVISVFADTPDKSYLFHIANGKIETLGVFDNYNSGSPESVYNFFIDAFNRYNSSIDIMILWDHGNGWYNSKSILYDNHPDDYISIIDGELKTIVKTISHSIGKKVDIIVFDACNMQSLEVLYEIKDYVKYSIGSEYIVPYYGMPYNSILPLIDDKSSIDDIGKIFCDEYFNKYADIRDSVQLSLIDLNGINDIIRKTIKSEYNVFYNINSIDVSIPNTIIKEYIYNRSNSTVLNGVKMFFPLYFDVYYYYYKDYIKLSIDKDYSIIKYEFPKYNVLDTFAPIPIDSFYIEPMNNSNYLVKTNKPFDFSIIKGYSLYYSKDYSVYTNDFSDTLQDFEGEYYFTNSNYYSSPFSIFTRNIKIHYTNKNNIFLGIKLKGFIDTSKVYIIENNDTLLSIDKLNSSKWMSFYTILNSDFDIVFNCNSNEYIYIDNIDIYSFNKIDSIISSDNSFRIHKLKKGNYVFFINSHDIYNNISIMDTIFYYENNDNVSIYVYPNPVHSTINIMTDFSGSYLLNIYTANGQRVLEEKGSIDNEIITVNINNLNLASGLYYIILKNNDNFYKTKFVKI